MSVYEFDRFGIHMLKLIILLRDLSKMFETLSLELLALEVYLSQNLLNVTK